MAFETYSVSVDFGGSFDETSFREEILAVAALAAKFQYFERVGDTVNIDFIPALTAGEKTTLDGVVSSHTGTADTDADWLQEFVIAESYLYKNLVYDSEDKLITVNIYKDSAKTELVYTKTLSYDSEDKLVTVVLTRIIDSATFTKTLTYDSEDKLEDVSRS